MNCRLPFLPLLVLPCMLMAQVATVAERFAKPSDSQLSREQLGWTRTVLPVPDDIVLEGSGILALPGGDLLVTTRRGEIWRVDNPGGSPPQPRYRLFAAGLHEPMGIASAPDGGYYVVQRQELTKITDRDGDGRADRFETIYRIPLSGSYHEFAFGPAVLPNGNIRLTLNNAYLAPTRSPVPWRGWMIEVQPNGKMIPIAAGMRSPAGVLVTSQGLCLFSENQGEWIGSCYVTEVQPGDFLGHPGSLAWSKLPGSPLDLQPEDIPDSGEPLFEVAKRIPALKPPTVWLPYTVLGISASGMVEDTTEGKFGPFSGQLFIGDQGQSKITRITLEKVKDVWQGAAYSFLQGFESGVIRLTFGTDGALYVGETARGWGAVGGKLRAFERVTWNGVTPFDLQEVKAAPDGFVLRFTRPVVRESASDPASYAIAGFTYQYHGRYGSPPINRRKCTVVRAVVSADGLTVRLGIVGLREGYIHEVKAPGVRDAATGEALVHDTAYYTLNRLPDGDRILTPQDEALEICEAPGAAGQPAASSKHPTEIPASWSGVAPVRTIALGTLPGLKFDQTQLTAKVGERIHLTFHNSDDMFHNFVLCTPGRGDAVGTAALSLGVEGPDRHYIPDTSDVLYHTRVLQPGETDGLYFAAPSAPGDYDYICSFPGHFTLMKGILRVVEP